MTMHDEARARARLSLEGLSVGDAFGETHGFLPPDERARDASEAFALEAGRWAWTDDTAMAISIVEQLIARGGIDEAALAEAFAARHTAEPGRGYGRGAHQVLAMIREGTPYDVAAASLFDGTGSAGNGGGMRSAPVGAYFAGDVAAVVEHARRSAAPTHANLDGIAGAIAIAVAAARVFAGERDGKRLLEAVIEHTPSSATRDGLIKARGLREMEPAVAAHVLGNGAYVRSADTVPFAVWCAARHVRDYEAAMWTCVDVGGDVDTMCAMVGGIVVGAVGESGIPVRWRSAREPLPQSVAAASVTHAAL